MKHSKMDIIVSSVRFMMPPIHFSVLNHHKNFGCSDSSMSEDDDYSPPEQLKIIDPSKSPIKYVVNVDYRR